jgi:hypothetical protein
MPQVVVESWAAAQPPSNEDMSTEAEEPPQLAAVTKQWLVKK